MAKWLFRRSRRPARGRRRIGPEEGRDAAPGAGRWSVDPRHRPPDYGRRRSREDVARHCGGALEAGQARQGRPSRPAQGNEAAMSWLSRVRSGIPFLPKRQTVENLWHKCKKCGTMVFTKEWEDNLYVCPRCDHHDRVGPKVRFDAMFDRQKYDILPSPEVREDPLKFR